MRAIYLLLLAPILALSVASTPAFAAKPCVPPEETAHFVNKDACVKAHVYDVVQLQSGTRFLDTCSPEMTDNQCHFTIISFANDQKDVGPLDSLKGRDIEIRGKVRDFTDHRELILSHQRQLHGGPEKFRPNPRLLQQFSASEHSMAFRDPNMRSGYTRHSGGHSKVR